MRNPAIDADIRLGKAGINKIIGWGMKNETYKKLFAHIPELTQKATVLLEEKPNAPDAHYNKYTHLACGIEIDGKPHTVHIILGENQGQWYYSHILLDIEKGSLLARIRQSTPTNQMKKEASQPYILQSTEGHPESASLSDIKDSTFLKLLQADSSKIVDENGEPLVVYHGTHTQFDTFDRNKGNANDAGWSGEGHYFYEDFSEATQYAQGKNGRIMGVFLNVREPYYLPNDERNDLVERDSREYSIAFSEQLKSDDYDGVYFNGDLRKEWTVFNSSQIKSATDNAGTFDPMNPSILFQAAEAEVVAINPDKIVDENGNAIEIKIDIPKNPAYPNYYKSHKITEIKIEPSLYEGQSVAGGPFQNEGSISKVSLAVLKGEVKPSRIENGTLFQPAFHGSPYRFDSFDSSHMGEGEGAQSYGWGHYFASEKKVAEYYRKMALRDFDENEQIINGKNIAEWAQYYEDLADRENNPKKRQMYYTVTTMLHNFDMAAYDRQEALRLAKLNNADPEAIKIFDDIAKEFKTPGQLYEVDIPSDDEMLDWDKTLDEQPEKVKKALGDIVYLLNEERGPGSKNPDLQYYGSSIYGYISEARGSDQAASQYLNSLGIMGIRYLDGSSRSKGEGSHNYVIFDDSSISITQTFFQIDDSDMMEEAASHDSWEDFKGFMEVFKDTPQEIEPWWSKEQIDAWYKSFWENSKKAKEAEDKAQEVPKAESTPADIDREFKELIPDKFKDFFENSKAWINEDFSQWGAVDEEDAAKRDRHVEISNELRRKLTHPTWQFLHTAKRKTNANSLQNFVFICVIR